MSDHFDYKELYTNIIRRQISLLGPQLAIAKARGVSGLSVDETGAVVAYQGDPKKILNDLISAYVAIFGTIVLESIKPIMEDFPNNHNNGVNAPPPTTT